MFSIWEFIMSSKMVMPMSGDNMISLRTTRIDDMLMVISFCSLMSSLIMFCKTVSYFRLVFVRFVLMSSDNIPREHEIIIPCQHDPSDVVEWVERLRFLPLCWCLPWRASCWCQWESTHRPPLRTPPVPNVLVCSVLLALPMIIGLVTSWAAKRRTLFLGAHASFFLVLLLESRRYA